MYIERLERFANLMMKVSAVLAVVTMVSMTSSCSTSRDDTDPVDGRSGMMLLTDSGTGCQYRYWGSLTPRMDANGKQICNVTR